MLSCIGLEKIQLKRFVAEPGESVNYLHNNRKHPSTTSLTLHCPVAQPQEISALVTASSLLGRPDITPPGLLALHPEFDRVLRFHQIKIALSI